VNSATILLTPNEANPLGVIGEVPDGKGGMIKGHMLVDVITQVAKFPSATTFLFLCSGPGGDVEVGDQIYDYMEGLKAEGKVVNTATVGDIGSIMTKPFLAGQEREVREEDKVYVHAPWVPHMEGNATQIARVLSSLYKDETKLLDFYKSKIGLNEAGLKGLMAGTADQDGTFMTADQAVALKFATKKATSKIKAFAQIKTKNMANETLGQKVDAVLAFLKGEKQTALNALPGEEGQPVGDPNSLPDGEYPLADGRVLVITGGQIAEVKMPAAAVAPVAPAAAAPADKALLDKVAALEAKNKEMEEEQKKALQSLSDFQATMVSGSAPKKAFNNNGGAAAPDTATHKSIAMKQREKQEQHRAQSLNAK
jgi:ATP-dependent protease ClpP protease subunit